MAEPHPFRRAAEAKDVELMTETLREDVVLHSPILFRGFEGRDVVSQVLAHVAATLEDLTYVDELVGEGTVALRFKANVGDRELEGTDLERALADGEVDRLALRVRRAGQPLEVRAGHREISGGGAGQVDRRPRA